MHKSNIEWLRRLKITYPHSFKNCKVLELGSGEFKLSLGTSIIRSFFENCEYVGIDKILGKNVDIEVKAKNTKFKKEYFDTLMCFSMFEHDPDWKQSLSHNLQWIKNKGMIFLSWGSERNKPHEPKPYKKVGTKEFFELVNKLPIKIIDHFFEQQRYGSGLLGVCDVIAIKEKK